MRSVVKNKDLLDGVIPNITPIFYRSCTPKKLELIRNFNIYLRENGLVILEVDKLMKDNRYKQLFGRIHLPKLVKNPSGFVLYKEQHSWTTTNHTLFSWEITNPRFFKSYMELLILNRDNLKCKFCPSDEILYVCLYCSSFYCSTCFEERRNYYYYGCNVFRCRFCKEVNILDD